MKDNKKQDQELINVLNENDINDAKMLKKQRKEIEECIDKLNKELEFNSFVDPMIQRLQLELDLIDFKLWILNNPEQGQLILDTLNISINDINIKVLKGIKN